MAVVLAFEFSIVVRIFAAVARNVNTVGVESVGNRGMVIHNACIDCRNDNVVGIHGDFIYVICRAEVFACIGRKSSLAQRRLKAVFTVGK